MRGLPNALEALAKMWGDHGGVKLSTLANGFIDNLVNYLLATEKDAKMDERPKYARRWSCSKGLKRPQVEYNEIKPLRPSSQPRAPRGYMLLPSWHIGCDKRGNIYQVFNCTKIKRSKPPRSATPRGKSVTKGRKTDVLQNMSNVRLNA